jgi:hypothetical protein
MPDEPASVEKPKHPLHALTTYADQAAMQARLDAVTAEQDDRARIARA